MTGGTLVVAFALTYLCHSTLVIGAAWLACAVLRRGGAELRGWLWRLALVGPLATSLLAVSGIVPGWGFQVAVDAAVPPREVAATHVSNTAEHEVAPSLAGRVFAPPANPADALPAARPVSAESFAVHSAGTPSPVRYVGLAEIAAGAVVLWVVGAVLALGALVLQAMELRRLRRRSRRADRRAQGLLDAIAKRMGLRHSVPLHCSPRLDGPIVAGWLPPRIYVPEVFFARLARRQQAALLAHELAHVAHGDTWWNLVSQIVCRVFFFQPLNFFANREIRLLSEFAADCRAAATLGEGLSLARCLTELADWMLEHRGPPRLSAAAVGMSAYRSSLGRRVVRLLETAGSSRPNRLAWSAALAAVAVALAATAIAGPRAVPWIEQRSSQGDSSMTSHGLGSTMRTLAVTLTLAVAPAVADDAGQNAPDTAEQQRDEARPAPLPEAVRGFNGQVTGTVAGRNEKGQVLFKVASVARVHERANKAADPKKLEGLTVLVFPSGGADSLPARFLAKMKIGDDHRLNVRHAEAAIFVITELSPEQRESLGAAVENRENRENREVRESPAGSERVVGDPTKVPPGVVGLTGRIIGRVVSRDVEKGELTVQVLKVDRVWKGNTAREPSAAEGRTLTIEKVFGKFLDVLVTLKEGDGVQIEVKHVAGDRLQFLGEALVKVPLEDVSQSSVREVREAREEKPSTPDKPVSAAEALAGLEGFRGILAGTLVSKDAEAGTFVFKMEKVERTWPQNRAPRPELSIGRSITVRDVSGKYLDVLLQIQPGERLEVEAFHVGGQDLRFVGEWLKKAPKD